jgi:hypothetical protein
MFTRPKSVGVFLVSAGFCSLLASVLMADAAGAYGLDLVKKCRALTEEAYPLRMLGNPAAGSDKGSGAEMRSYYKNCVEAVSEAFER